MKFEEDFCISDYLIEQIVLFIYNNYIEKYILIMGKLFEIDNFCLFPLN